jgi:hypothetical protein
MAADALLLVARQCPHCAALLEIMAELVKQGRVGALEIVNVEAYPERAREIGVRGVPWLRLGPFELVGARSRTEIDTWLARIESPTGMADYFHALLKEGELDQVLALVRAEPVMLGALLPILANPEASLNVRLGAGVVFEDMAGDQAFAGVVDALLELARHDDPRVRADACHYLGLSRAERARPTLLDSLTDTDADVREIAAESLEALDTQSHQNG